MRTRCKAWLQSAIWSELSRRPFALLYPFTAVLCVLIFTAQTSVSITANLPAHGLTILSGSQRILNVQLNGASTGLVNWSSASGGVTFTTPYASGPTATGFIPSVMIVATAPPGHCSIDGSNTWRSTQTLTITAQSVDDASKSVTFPLVVCANTTVVRLKGAIYQQAWLGQTATVTADVQGNSNQNVTWSVTSAPASAVYALADAAARTASLTASTPGRYVLQAASAADLSVTATATIYVAANAAPTYSGSSIAGVSTSFTPVAPCTPDPGFTGPLYTVGAGKRYADLVALPNTTTLGGGTMVQIFNTAAAGATPSTFHNYWQFATRGSASQPIYMCGVPNAAGDLPIVDGNDATGQANVLNIPAPNQVCYQATIFCFYAGIDGGHPTGQYGPSNGPSFITLANLHIRNARGNVYLPGKTTGPEAAMIGPSACIALTSGSAIDLYGLEIENCANGVYTSANFSNGFADYSQQVSIRGVNIHGFGNANSPTEHALYFQSWWGLVEDFYIHDPVASDAGSAIKWRGVDGIFRYGLIQAAGVARPYDGVEDQDSSAEVDTDQYVNSGAHANGDGTPDIIAGLEENYFNGDWIYGVTINGASGAVFHHRADHTGYLAERAGRLFVYNNTVVGGVLLFDIGDAQYGAPHYLDSFIDFRNNLFWGIGVVNNYAQFWGQGITNLWTAANIPWLPGAVTRVRSWYITGGGQLVVNAANNLLGDQSYASGVSFAGLSGSSGACLNGSLFKVQYADHNAPNFQGPTQCPATGSASAPIMETGATAIPHIGGGSVNAVTAHGWSNQCYSADGSCSWQNTVPIDNHVFNLTAANYLGSATQPFDSNWRLNAVGRGFAGSALPATMTQLPVRFQYDAATHSLQPFASAGVIGAHSAASSGL